MNGTHNLSPWQSARGPVPRFPGARVFRTGSPTWEFPIARNPNRTRQGERVFHARIAVRIPHESGLNKPNSLTFLLHTGFMPCGSQPLANWFFMPLAYFSCVDPTRWITG